MSLLQWRKLEEGGAREIRREMGRWDQVEDTDLHCTSVCRQTSGQERILVGDRGQAGGTGIWRQ